ncbi:PH domain-containing protein [Ureibacillus acetophenoni]
MPIKGNQLTIIYRIFSRVTFLVEKKRIQVIERKQSVFQKRRKLQRYKRRLCRLSRCNGKSFSFK